MPSNPHRVQPIERFPAKPRADGRFQKRINGVLYYFGQDGDRVAALAEYDRLKHRLYAGETVKVRVVGKLNDASIKDLANRFLFDKKGEIADITYRQYKDALTNFARHFGPRTPWVNLTVDDFTAYAKSLKRRLGGYAFNRDRAAIVAMFNYADRQDWIDRAPKFGEGFRKAARSTLRDTQRETIISRDDLAAMLCAASRQTYAMMLLATNGGYGPADLRLLEWGMIDLDRGVIRDRRAKTKIRRVVTLWPETVHALKRLKRWDGWPLVFRTRAGNQWRAGEISHQVGVAIERSGLTLPARSGLYSLRHTFATLANEVRDADARRCLMGRRLTGLDDVYVASIFEPRLKAVTDHVRQALSIPNLVGDVVQ
jgi:integrase